MAEPLLRLDEFLPYRLSITSNLVSDTIARVYQAQFGLRIPEWRLIAVVAERDGINQQEICERTRMDKVTVSRAAIALTERGLIERRTDASDRRARKLVLTPEGCELYAAIAPRALELERQIFASFPARELEQFTAMLERIDAAALDAGSVKPKAP